MTDPQISQIRDVINKLRERGGRFRLLDFGAGKGRLAAAIFDLEENQEAVRDWLDYIAFDVDQKDREQCQNAIQRIYGGLVNKYFVDEKAILSAFDKCSFDMIVMCNVFHEIDPKDWLGLFSPGGIILQLLKEDGYLLLVEDYLMPIGEKTYQKGFLVLDTLQIKRLFKIEEKDTLYHESDARGDGRLKAHLIPKQYLSRISADSRIEAIQMVNKISETEIKKIRNKEPSFKNGRLHGFWSQQLVNSQFALAELNSRQ